MSAPKRGVALLAAIALTAGCQATLQSHSDAAVKRVNVNGAEIAYVEQGSGETVIFVHGLGTDLRVWDALRRHFPRRYRFVAYSRRHHVPNAWPDDGNSHTVAQHVDDLDAFVAALGVESAHIVAASLGARMAGEAMVKYPRRVRSIVLNDSLIALPVAESAKVAMQAFFERFSPFLENVKAGHAEQTVVALVDFLSPDGWSALPTYRQRIYLDNVRTLALAVADTTARRPSCAALGQVKPPVLVLAGERTPAAFRVSNERLVECLPQGTEYALVPDAGHFWYADNPAGASRRVVEFLDRHRK